MWENLAARELEFYRDKDKHFQDIEDRIKEIEEDCYVFPVGYWDEETGMYRKTGRKVEDQVIEKIELENGVLAVKKKIINRCSRIEFALSKLEDHEREPIVSHYLHDKQREFTQKQIREAIRALRKFYRFIMIQRMDKHRLAKKVHEMDKLRRIIKFKG